MVRGPRDPRHWRHAALGAMLEPEVSKMTLTKTRVVFERPIDYRDEITAPAGRVRFLGVPKRRYLMVEGTARPAEQGFRDAIGTLYPVAYTLHFALKKRGVDAPVGALEG